MAPHQGRQVEAIRKLLGEGHHVFAGLELAVGQEQARDQHEAVEGGGGGFAGLGGQGQGEGVLAGGEDKTAAPGRKGF